MIWTIDWWGYSLVEVTVDNVNEAVNACNHGRVDGVRICEKYESDDFSFINRIDQMRAMVIAHPRVSAPVIRSLKALKCLHIQGPLEGLDLSTSGSLLWLSLYWDKSVRLPSNASDLRNLTLYGYSPQSRDLSDLPAYDELSELTLRGGRIQRLDGISRLRSLRTVQINGLRSLESLGDLANVQVESLECEGLSRCVRWWEEVAMCGTLMRLVVAKCPPMRSLKWLGSMTTLREFRFVDTDVLDGDMRPLLSLDVAAFSPNRRHFSHTCEAVQQEVAKRGGDASKGS